MDEVTKTCGGSVGSKRPVLGLALHNSSKPAKVVTVFAGQDMEATARARSYFTGYPPSSPSIGILHDGKLVYMMERRQIESRDAQAIAAHLKPAFYHHCATPPVL